MPELVFWESRSHRAFLCQLLATPVHRRWTLSTEGGLMLEPSAPYPIHVYVPGAIDFNCKRWLSCCYHARVGFLGIAFSSRFPLPPARNPRPPKVDSAHQRWTHACAECTIPYSCLRPKNHCKLWLTCPYLAQGGFLGIAFSSRFPVPPARNPCPPNVDSVHQRWTHA